MLLHSFGVETVARAVRRPLGVVFALAVAVVLSLGTSAGTAAAAELQVEVDGTDAGNCQADPCATIQYALGQAVDGDVIEVGAGEYSATTAGERIVLDKVVTVSGAQAGVDARDRDVPAGEETVIVGGNYSGGAVRLSAVGATLDGVTVTGHEHAAIQGMTTASGYAIRNTIVTDNDHGLDLETVATDATPTVVERNRFEANNRPGLQSGIYGDGPLESVSIRDNLFTGHTNVPINVAAPTAAERHDLEIVGNTFLDERHVIVTATDGAVVSGNTFSDGRSRALSIQGGVHDLTVEGNVIEGGIDAGILFADRHGEGANSTATITGNSISGVRAGDGGTPVNTGAAILLAEEGAVSGYTGTLTVDKNRLVDNQGGGIQNDSTVATVDAPDNWWGCNGGPGAVGCDNVWGDVDASPNVVLSAQASAARVTAGTPVTVTASLDRNSAGDPVELPVLEGREIAFASNHGTVEPEAAQIVDGSASTQLTSTEPVGAITVAAAFDDELEGADVFVGSAPAIGSADLSGSGKVGEQLTCAANGLGGLPEPAVTYGWSRDGAALPGETGASYTPSAADVGSAIACRVAVTNEFGSADAQSGAITVTEAPKPPKPPKPPVIKPKTNVTVPRSGKVVLAAVRCPDGPCRIKTTKRVRVRIRGKVYVVRVKAPARVGNGKTGRVRLVLPPRARKAIRGTRTRAKVKVVVTSKSGKRRVINRGVVLRGVRR